MRISWAELFRRALLPALLTLLLLLLPFSRSGIGPFPELVNRAQPAAPVCPPLPAHGPEQQLSVFVVPTRDRPGIVCVRVYNRAYAQLAAFAACQRWVWALTKPQTVRRIAV